MTLGNFRPALADWAIDVKVLDEMFHPKLQPAHAIPHRLSKSFLIRQLIVRDPVAGNHRARSIRATPAMDKNWPLSARIQQS